MIRRQVARICSRVRLRAELTNALLELSVVCEQLVNPLVQINYVFLQLSNLFLLSEGSSEVNKGSTEQAAGTTLSHKQCSKAKEEIQVCTV